MNTVQLTLTDTENMSLLKISEATGKTVNELFQEALQTLMQQLPQIDRRDYLRQARGMWKNRQDLPSVETLRREWEQRNIMD